MLPKREEEEKEEEEEEEEDEVVAQPHYQMHFTLLCYQEIICCNLECCSWVWMGAFIYGSLPEMKTENLPVFTGDC